MTSDLSEILLKLYEPRFREQFQHHPRGNEIVDGMLAGDYNTTEIDQLFYEARAYGVMHLMKVGKGAPSVDEKFIFEGR